MRHESDLQKIDSIMDLLIEKIETSEQARWYRETVQQQLKVYEAVVRCILECPLPDEEKPLP